MSLKKYSFALVIVFVFLSGTDALSAGQRAGTKTPSAQKISLSKLKAKARQFGAERGKYDAVHKMFDYREKFKKDSQRVPIYWYYQINVDGSQSPTGPDLVEKLPKLSYVQKQDLISIFTSAYVKEYTLNFRRKNSVRKAK